MPAPEDQARENIDQMLAKSGWAVGVVERWSLGGIHEYN